MFKNDSVVKKKNMQEYYFSSKLHALYVASPPVIATIILTINNVPQAIPDLRANLG